MKVFTIVWLTLLEARRRKLTWLVLALSVAFMALYAVAFYFVYKDITRFESSGGTQLFETSNTLLLMGLYVVAFLTVMLGVLTSDTLAGEIASGTIHTVVTKPLRRWEVVVGKWLGYGIMLTGFVLLMSLGLTLIVRLISGYSPPDLARGVALMVLQGWVVLTVSILGGTRLSTIANGVVALMLYGLAFIAGWIEQIGALTRNEAAVNIGIVTSLIMPSEAMWKRAAYLMQPPFLRELGISPFGAASAPSVAMVAYAVVYMVVALALAVRLFERRDL